tara:strand:- start:282 stop:665 length:384 start_codon:yes stop_codon:yes gene_type:complete
MIHKAIINLLLLIMAMQPVLALGQFTSESSEPSARSSQMGPMACVDTMLAGTTEHLAQEMSCDNMASADCLLAAQQGNCGTVPSVLVPERTNLPAPTATAPAQLHPLDGYLSVILDTFTPPPNSSKA